jgi:hypothetical protein
MTLRESLGGDAQRIYEEIDALLDSEDALLVVFDGARMVSYIQGFGVSPCQLELLNIELERAVRDVVGFGDAGHGDSSGAGGDRLRMANKTA